MKKVTIGIVNFNGINSTPATLQSVTQLDYPSFEILVVDNNSTDGSREWIQTHFKEVRCICLDSNLGSAAARNIILEQTQADYVFTLDNDIVVEPDALTKLMEVMEDVPNTGVCHPEIRDKNDPFVYHYNGGFVHYLCTSISRDDPKDLVKRPKYEVFDVVSGAALLINRKAASHVGNFDADYFFNMEDGDFTSRLTLAGYLCLNVPGSIVHHRSKQHGTSRFFYQVRNRWFFILKLFSWRTLLLGAPAFLLFELSQAMFCLIQGGGKDYLKGNIAALGQLPNILRKRKIFQALKVKRDRDWLQCSDIYIPDSLLKGRPMMQILKNVYVGFFKIYWKLIRFFC